MSATGDPHLREYGDRWGFDGWELHCGDCFLVQDPSTGAWLDVRMEHSSADGWYLYGLPVHLWRLDFSNFKVRRYS